MFEFEPQSLSTVRDIENASETLEEIHVSTFDTFALYSIAILEKQKDTKYLINVFFLLTGTYKYIQTKNFNNFHI